MAVIMRRLGGLAMLLVVTLLVAGCTTTQAVRPTENQRVAMAAWTDAVPPYRINPGDKLRVFFERTPELNEIVPVAPDGTIGLRAAGILPAAGHTLDEVRGEIIQASSRILRAPVVNVTLEDPAGAVVYVGGSVKQPGVYPLSRPIGVMEAVIRAQGFDAEARMNQIVLIRRNAANQPMLRTIDVQEFASSATLADDVPLAAGDIVFVPRNRASEVDQWVDQFINRVIPFSRSFGYVVQSNGTPLTF